MRLKKTILLQRMSKISPAIAKGLMLAMLLEFVPNPNLFALTGGPSQPEVQSFEPVGSSEMVDLSTGDFNYNIPVMDIGGYPLNLSYHAGAGMDEEASWTGLGFNLNPGVLNRSMRGLPDDFNGDKIKTQFHRKADHTYSVAVNPGSETEIFGIENKKLGANVGIKFNNYRGVGFDFGIRPTIPIGKTPLNASLGLNFDSYSGLSLSPGAGVGWRGGNGKVPHPSRGFGMSIGSSLNSRTGLQAVNFGIKAASRGTHVGINQSGAYSFSTPTYSPNVSNDMVQSGFAANSSAGSETAGFFNKFGLNASFQLDQPKNNANGNPIEKKAFGYYYEHFKMNGSETDVLLDFNREKDVSFSDNTVNLPLTNHTYDVFSATGQGVGGSYRLFRSDVPMVHDDQGSSNGWRANLGGEIGAGALMENGLNVGAAFSRSRSGVWKTGKNSINVKASNGMENKWNFVPGTGNVDYEPVFFKSASDKSFTSAFDNARYNDKTVASQIKGANSVSSNLYVKEGLEGAQKIDNTVEYLNGNKFANTRAGRESRNSVMSVLNKKESEKYGLESHIRTYLPVDPNNPVSGGLGYSNFISRPGEDHHFSEVTLLQEGGQRYIYGIPAYNHLQYDKTFNVSGRTRDCDNGQLTYQTISGEEDNTEKNRRGDNHLFQFTHTPAYAHSYLLTGYLSDDYVDVTSNGISDDDLGTAVKFNYTLATSNYKWRVPYKAKSVSLSEGQRSNPNDDLGNYSYGEKELWYMHSMETKTQVALFFTSPRDDAHGVIDEHGGLAQTEIMQKLDKIVLYSKQDFEKNGVAATPIKTVHFEYKYTLCPNVDNNSGNAVMVNGVNINANKGKLTLDKLYFTYGKSNKGRTSSYEFDYSQINPDYHLKGSDAWGTYKESPSYSCNMNDAPTNADFPYTDQNKTTSDNNASSWCLTKITLPSGGSIKVEYEADDYAYVQDRKAMHMFKIAGFGHSHDWEATVSDDLYTSKQLDSHHDLIYVDLPETLSGPDKDEEFRRKYLKGISDLQFTLFVDIDGNDHYEYVKGYCDIDISKSKVLSSGTRACIHVKKVNSLDKARKNKMISPLAITAWNYARINFDHMINQTGVVEGSGTFNNTVNVSRKLIGFAFEIGRSFKGYYNSLQDRNFCKTIKPARSWVRLLTPNGKKLGGGHRVKKIFVNDDWANIGSGNSVANDAEYGTEYIYTTTRKNSNDELETISSGVASYEPTIGGDENPFRLPLVMEQKNKWIPSPMYYLETPIGESFYPGATVVYSKVKTQAIGNNNIKRTGTGYTVSEYYTAKDFPTFVSFTQLDKQQKRANGLASISPVRLNSVAASQGYKIELNDMHGKPKASSDYDEYGKKVGGVEYQYQHEYVNGKKHLTNTVKTVSRTGAITEKEFGVEIDMVNDARASTSVSTNYSLALNLNTFTVGLFPVPIPLILPGYGRDENDFFSMVTTKVVKRFGILEKTIAFKAGSSIETQNLLYDDQTGHLLLTGTQNEFSDQFNKGVYSFNYPAHWAYEKGMGQAYKNIGLSVSGVKLAYDQIIFPNSLDEESYLVEGDEVSFELDGVNYSNSLERTPVRYYVYRGTGGNLNLIDKVGISPLPSDYNKSGTLTVLRSGRRNKASASIGSVTTLANPAPTVGGNLAFSQVIDAAAVAYKDDWKTHFSYMPNEVCDTNALGYDAWMLLDCLKDQLKPNTNLTIKVIGYNSYKTIASSFRVDDGTQITDYPVVDGQIPTPIPVLGTNTYSYLNKNDNTWYTIDIFDKSAMETIGLEASFNSSSISDINLCTGPCSSWYVGSTLQDQIEALKAEHCPNPVSCDERITITFSNGKMVLTLGANNCEPPSCLMTITNPSLLFSSINQLLSYNLSSDGTKMIITAEVQKLDGSGTSEETFSVDRCGLNMRKCEILCYDVAQEYAVNPFTMGIQGNWRPYKNYKYLENRNYQAGSPDTKKDGQYSSFSSFWTYSGGQLNPSAASQWVNASEITKYSPFGQELETKDALNRHTAEQYGFFHTLPVAAAGNAEYTQIGYDGFEDYDYVHQKFEFGCETRHFDFPQTNTAQIDDAESHSGWHSFKLDPGAQAEMARPIDVPVIPNTSVDENINKKLTQSDDLGVFSPSAGTYVLGAWVKENRNGGMTAYTDAKIRLEFLDQNNVTTSTDLQASGLIIEGWQRVYGTFEVPVGTKSISIKLMGATEVATWFDDLRVHPNKATMKSFAYDATTLRNMAAMDENNYATFYEYDAEGSLIRVKKETAKGIITIQENRTHINK